MPSLVVPGVSVETRFDVLPPLPAASGVVGVAAVVDRPPSPVRLVGVTKVAELAEVLGPGTAASAPEIVHALANGAAEVVVAPVTGGSPAGAALNNADSEPCVLLRARSNGEWANQLAVDIRTVTDSDGNIVRVNLRLLRRGAVVEQYADLVVQPSSHQDLFDTINGQSAYVVAVDPGFAASQPAPGSYVLDADGVDVPVQGDTDVLFTLLPDRGVDPAGVTVAIAAPAADDITVRISRDGALQEEFAGLTMNPDSAEHLATVLLRDSALVTLRTASSLDEDDRLPAATTGPVPFTNGTSPNLAAYQTAIDLLAEDARINLVTAAIEPTQTAATVRAIHQALSAHAVTQADGGSPRIAFGAVTAAEQPDLDQMRDHAAAVRSRRFVLVSPAGASGAVIGLVARLSPEVSPTFKPVPLFGIPPASYRESQLNRLLGPTHNLVVVQQRVNRGVIVLRGLDTTGDQISVTRVADACIREVKAISENFIGELNTVDARNALRQQIIATFTRMERAGALVPSTDGTDPAFLVDVYSTQLDFAQGSVRVDIAVRPVRAIDFVYATIRVKN
jgi:tail sheath protein